MGFRKGSGKVGKVRSELNYLPEGKKRELAFVVEAIREGFAFAIARRTMPKLRGGRLLKIILFGSYARGDWVEDPVGRYFSDYDLTRPGAVSMARLVRSTLRLRLDRIVVGEVRGAEALDMLKAWNTGHPGGIATVHANGALAALYRFEQLFQEAIAVVPRRLIAEAIDLIVFIEGRGMARRIASIADVEGLDSSGDYALRPLAAESS